MPALTRGHASAIAVQISVDGGPFVDAAPMFDAVTGDATKTIPVRLPAPLRHGAQVRMNVQLGLEPIGLREREEPMFLADGIPRAYTVGEDLPGATCLEGHPTGRFMRLAIGGLPVSLGASTLITADSPATAYVPGGPFPGVGADRSAIVNLLGAMGRLSSDDAGFDPADWVVMAGGELGADCATLDNGTLLAPSDANCTFMGRPDRPEGAWVVFGERLTEVADPVDPRIRVFVDDCLQPIVKAEIDAYVQGTADSSAGRLHENIAFLEQRLGPLPLDRGVLVLSRPPIDDFEDFGDIITGIHHPGTRHSPVLPSRRRAPRGPRRRPSALPIRRRARTRARLVRVRDAGGAGAEDHARWRRADRSDLERVVQGGRAEAPRDHGLPHHQHEHPPPGGIRLVPGARADAERRQGGEVPRDELHDRRQRDVRPGRVRPRPLGPRRPHRRPQRGRRRPGRCRRLGSDRPDDDRRPHQRRVAGVSARRPARVDGQRSRRSGVLRRLESGSRPPRRRPRPSRPSRRASPCWESPTSSRRATTSR